MKVSRKSRQEITHFYRGIGVSLGRLTPVAFRRGVFGKIRIFRHPELGKVFVLNEEIQHVEAWAPLYHEPLVHLAASFVPEIRNVLILGGGTLYAAAEALKYKSVERVVVFERDKFVPEITAQHYEHARACFKDSRFTLIHEEAYGSIARFKSQFDLIVNDGADLISVNNPPKRPGHTKPGLFSAMTDALVPSGVCADVVYRHLFERKRTLTTISQLKEKRRVAMSLIFIPEYHGILHLLTVWGKPKSGVSQSIVRPHNKEQLTWINNGSSQHCAYYDPRFLRYYLYLPPYFKNVLSPKRRAS